MVEHWALVRLDQIQLAIPQTEVKSLESVEDIALDGLDVTGRVGWYHAGDVSIPVYVFDDDLRPREQLNERKICVLLSNRSGSMGLICSQLRVAPVPRTTLFSVPPAMRRTQSPLLGLMYFDDEFIMCTGLAALMQWLATLRPAPKARLEKMV